ncbi:MAG TPA: response regulator transcription factor [Anaerolineales bacterium]|nr:response regulator transcription factor [Anaerolineales bacterium]
MDLRPAAVLIIENHPLMRSALCNAIAAEPGLQVAEVDINDPESLAIPGPEDIIFLPRNLDMILLALSNPGLKELDVLKMLRALLPEIPVLALTSNEVAGQEQAALEAGARGVVTKTASRSEIIQALRDMHSKNSRGQQ